MYFDFNLYDKYFGDLGDFNKELVAHKRAFWNGCQGLSFFDFLKKLSFQLDHSASNFRFGQRYFSREQKKFVWKSSDKDGCMLGYVWNPYDRVRTYEKYKVQFTSSMLSSHFLSCFSQNRLVKFYYKLPDCYKNELSDYKTALINMYKVDGKTYGSSQQENSSILLIDIDNYEDDKAIDKFKKFLLYTELKVKDFIFIEQNAFTGGIHCALQLKNIVNSEGDYKNLERVCYDNGFKIECNFQNKLLRFPLSFEYVALKHDERILDTDEFVSKEYWEETYSSFKEHLNFKPVESIFINKFLFNIKYEDSNTFTNSITINQVIPTYWNTKKVLVKRVNESTPITPKFKKLYKITAGNRWKLTGKMVPYIKSMGKTLIETAEILKNQNEDSKDLTRWSVSKIADNIRSFYLNCRTFNVGKSLNSNYYCKNNQNIPEITLNFLNDKRVQNHLVNKFISNYIKARSKHNEYFDHLSEEKIDILKKVLPIMFIEVIGKMFYEINNPKEFIDNIDEELGFQLPDVLMNRIQDYAIKQSGIDSPIAKTSLQYLKKAIIATLGLREINYKHSKRNWQIGSCKSFRIQSLNDINGLLNHLYNSVYTGNVIKEFLFNNNNIISSNILYISLQQNQAFDILTGEILDEIDKSPPD